MSSCAHPIFRVQNHWTEKLQTDWTGNNFNMIGWNKLQTDWVKKKKEVK